MKKICFLFLFLTISFVKAQQSYYLVEVEGYIGNAGSCGSLKGLREFKLTFDDGSEEILNKRKYENEFFAFESRILDGRKINTVTIVSKRQTNDFWGCNNNDDITDLENVNGRTCYTRRNNNAFGVTDGWYELKITPVLEHRDVGANATIIEDVPIELGIENNVVDPVHFNWKYSVDSGATWSNLPVAFQNDDNISIAGQDFLNNADYGKEVFIYIDTQCNDSRSNVLVFDARKSAPYIVDNDPPVEPRCFGNSDGSITLTFSRDLLPDEHIALAVEDLTNGNESLSLDDRFDSIPRFDAGNKLTITGLPKSGIDGYRAVVFNANLYTDGSGHSLNFEVGSPEPTEFFVVNATKVNCFAGSDGTFSLQAHGGTNDNYEFELTRPNGTIDSWRPFEERFDHTITGLSRGSYAIRVRDGNGCIVKEISDTDNDGELEIGDDVIRRVTIEAPDTPLELVFEESRDASAAEFTDGAISIRVFGGTPNADATYNVTWKDENDNVLTTVDAQVITEGYFVTLRDIGAGSYVISVTDANYNGAVQKEGCAIFDMEFRISEPPPLTAYIEETNPISCNGSNEFNDPFSDGELIVHAKGGVPLEIFENNGLPYFYTWKKEDDNGIFQVLTQETDSVLRNISVGRYSVNVEDANGIIIGEYENNVLVHPSDVIYDLGEPEPITLRFKKENVDCEDGLEGWAEAIISGGSGVYQLKWSNGETANRVENLQKGTYLLYVTDEKGCEATGQVKIDAPNALSIEIAQRKDPTCNDGKDGVIEFLVSGGVAPYSYQWSGNGVENVTLSRAEGLMAGNYTVTVTDANACTKILNVTLENPSPSLIDLGKDRTLCGGQSIILDATFSDTGTTYLWTSNTGFTSTSPIIEISDAGTYSVAVTTPLGCSGGDTVNITTSEAEIDAHFVVSTQAFAGQELALINISSPLGETVEWFFPPEAEIVVTSDEAVILLFSAPGSYDVILRSNQGDCYLDFMKSVIVGVSETIPDIGDAELPFIQDFIVHPNPSFGNFKVELVLAEASDISLKLFSMASQRLVDERRIGARIVFSIDYGLALASGSYILLLETAKGSEIRKVLIE